MWTQWDTQKRYMMNAWSIGTFLATVFVVVNLFGQLVPCVFVLIRKQTDIACGVLFFTIALQVSI